MRDRVFQIERVGDDGFQFEVMVYGAASSGRQPLLILHSIEYPVPPTQAYCEWMWEEGVQVIFVRRPGFNLSTPLPNALMHSEAIKSGATTIMEAVMLASLIRMMRLKDVLLLSLGSANPVSYRLVHLCPEISRTLFSNPPFNQDIISAFRHPWLQKMLRQMLETKSGIRVAESGLKLLVKNNPLAFYRSILKRSPGDVAYITSHMDDLRRAAEISMAATSHNLYHDVVMSLSEDPLLKDNYFAGVDAAVMIGAEGTEFWKAEMRRETDRLGLPLHVAETGDIMSAYASPVAVLALLRQQHMRSHSLAV